MKNVRPAFEKWEGSKEDIPPGYQQIKCHMIFDIKIGEGFRRKSCYVGGGHTTTAPTSLTYSSVVSRDSVRIALLISAVNDLKVLSCDIQNVYLTVKCRKNIWTIAGPEFGPEEQGSIMIVKMALYRLKTSGAAFRALLVQNLHDMSFKPSKADPDYENVICYVDDVIAISGIPMKIMDETRKKFTLKNDADEDPETYLGSQLRKISNANGIEGWFLSSEKYVKSAVTNVEEKLLNNKRRMPTWCYSPLTTNYALEMDATPELKADDVQYYQELIGLLRWAVDIGRIDILIEVSLMSSYLASPREGHLEEVIHIFGYLKHKPKQKILLVPQRPIVIESRFLVFSWEDLYCGAKENIAEDMPQPRDKSVSTHCFVDANHAGDKSNRRLQTGVLLFGNRAPILWYSKRQNIVMTSTFGSEFTAMKTAVKLIESLRYKLQIFGVDLDGPTDVYCDNEAVYKNTSNPTSCLNKKHHSVSYHRCREAVACKTIRVSKEGTNTNLSDIFTKMMGAEKRESLLRKFTY